MRFFYLMGSPADSKSRFHFIRHPNRHEVKKYYLFGDRAPAQGGGKSLKQTVINP
jgi:hypothetical protein